jgi:hypothetical protein
MAHVFISYSRRNKAYARRLAEHLQSHGFDVWIDERIDYGTDWMKAIQQAISTCGALIVIMTHASEKSEWVQIEITYAKNCGKPVFPLLLSGENWFRFVQTQFVDVSDESMPPDAFLEDLQAYVTRKRERGVNITTTGRGLPAVPIDPRDRLNAPQPNWKNSQRRSRVPLIAGAMIGVGLLIGAALILPRLSSDAHSVTPTAETTLISGMDTATSPPLPPTDTPVPPTETLVSPSDTPMPPSNTPLPPSDTPLPPTDTPILNGSEQIVFNSQRDGNGELYLINVDGTNLIRLTYNPADDNYPTWSPDGMQIAFFSNRDGDYDIYALNADGTNLRPLTDNDTNDLAPAWSPDGSRIAFLSYRDGSAEIYVMNADGSSPINLSNDETDDYFPAWSPDGRQIAFVSGLNGDYDIYAINVDGSNLRNLTNHLAEDARPA